MAQETEVYGITAGGDDGHADSLNETFTAVNNGSFIGNTDPQTRSSFQRFSVSVPRGAVILAAKLTFKSWSNRAEDTVRVKIVAEDEDNPSAPTTYADFMGRARTTAEVHWDGIVPWTTDTVYDSPDFAAVIQEVVNRPGWNPGNALTIFIDEDGSDVGARRMYYTFETDGNSASPDLTITYWTADGSGVVSFSGMAVV